MIRTLTILAGSALTVSLALGGSVLAQGSIYGSLANSDLSTPAEADVTFFGFLRGTTNEIRVSGSDGIDYDSGNWYDDFQNYTDEAPGVSYDYWFFDQSQSELLNLSAQIPNNSFQQEDIQLLPGSYPAVPQDVSAVVGLDNSVTVSWTSAPSTSYHVFRRSVAVNGSYFRVDDTSGSLSSGVTSGVFLDESAADPYDVEYVIIAYDGASFSPPSPAISTAAQQCCVGMTGNVDGDAADMVDISDITQLIDYLWITNQPLPCPAEANMDGDAQGLIDVADITYLIDYLWITNTPLAPCPH
jgi:hypothetical protein